MSESGNPAPAEQEMFGRDALVRQAWHVLAHASILLTGPGGIGKTTLARALSSRPEPGFRCYYLNLRDADSIEEFAAKLDEAIGVGKITHGFGFSWARRHLIPHSEGGSANAIRIIKRVFDHVPVKLPEITVFFFDDFTQFLDRLSEGQAEDLLHFLRRVRQETGNVRMVYVDRQLRSYSRLSSFMNRGGVTSAVNDMHQFVIPELSMAESVALGRQLLSGSKATLDDKVLHRMAEFSGGAPLAIRIMAAALSRRSGESQLANWSAEAIKNALIADPANPVSLPRVESLISEYTGHDAEVARRLLKRLADSSDGGLVLDAQTPTVERRVIDLLKRDGFLANESANRVGFAHKLLHEWVRNEFLKNPGAALPDEDR